MSGFNENEENEICVGIDLGTTFSCVSVWNEETKKVDVLANSFGQRTMPSYVGFTSQGRVVGMGAKQQAAVNSKNTVYDVKRIIGREWNDPVVQEEIKRFPYTVVDRAGSPMIEVEWLGQTKTMSPQEISGMVLTELKRCAESALGKPVKNAVITVPAYFNDQQRQATKDAGRIAGLNVKRIINEPTAAALAYGLESKTDKPNVVIFDLGGGTFDVSVLSMQDGVFAVKATGGDTHLGGEDFDNCVVEWALAEYLKGAGVENKKSVKDKAIAKLKSNARAVRRLQQACENAKRTLSSSETTTIEVSAFTQDYGDLSIELTRAKFEELNKPLFDSCMKTVANVLKDASVQKAEVTDIVLVGGSTRVPALQNALTAYFDNRIKLCKTINPDEAVAVGAAVQGRILMAGGSGGGLDLCPELQVVLLDVTPLSLGIELEGGVMSVLIKRNSPIPCRKSREYTTVEDFQTELDICVYEGERSQTAANNKLGEFRISGIERARKGEAKIEVTFNLDANGILNVSARDLVTEVEASATMTADKGRLTEEQIEKMVLDGEKYRALDEEFALKVRYRNVLEEAMFSCMSAVSAKGNNEADMNMLNNLQEWLDYDAENATLERFQKQIDSLKDKFGVKIDLSNNAESNAM